MTFIVIQIPKFEVTNSPTKLRTLEVLSITRGDTLLWTRRCGQMAMHASLT